MSISRKALIGGMVGAIIAISLIAAGALAFAGGNSSFFGLKGSSGTSTGLASSTTAITAGQSGSTSSGSSSSSGSSGSTGTLQIRMIDPPNVPPNVVDVYVNYTSIEVHVANAGNQSGWYNVTSSGTIDLMKIVSNSKVL